MRLYTYYRSSAAYRVRIALNLKGLDYDSIPVHLVKDGGQHRQADYLTMNPQGLVPMLEHGSVQLSQSLAIIEYLDEVHPEPMLLPQDAVARAQVRSLAQAIACDIHPINNLRVLQYLINELNQDDATKNAWYRHWIVLGFKALEETLVASENTGEFCYQDAPSLADCCLVPQVYNAQRFNVDMGVYPTLERINRACLKLTAFARAAPENQPDAE